MFAKFKTANEKSKKCVPAHQKMEHLLYLRFFFANVSFA